MTIPFIEALERADSSLFLFLNGLHTETLDEIMWWISDRYIWTPLYLALFYLTYKKYNLKAVFIALLLIGIMIFIADKSSVYLFKEAFKRYRPCHNHEIAQLVHTVKNYCGGLYGFVSSHATNTFALAVFYSMVFYKRLWYISPVLLLWAAIGSYSRIYLGVHYPSDVLVGALFGSLMGYLMGKAFNKISANYTVLS